MTAYQNLGPKSVNIEQKPQKSDFFFGFVRVFSLNDKPKPQENPNSF